MGKATNLQQKKSGSGPYVLLPDFFCYCRYPVDLDTEFLSDILRNGVLVNHEVHNLVSAESLCHIPDSLVVAILTPRVLDHVVLLAVLVFCQTEEVHTVVVCCLPVVESLLTHLLCDLNLRSVYTERVEKICLLSLSESEPFCSVAARKALNCLCVDGNSETLTCEALL